MPYLPYGVKGPLIETRQIILLQFIKIQNNYNNLKVTKGRTQVELVDTYKDLKVPPYTQSRHANLYRVILYYFPIVVKLIATSALSKALFSKRQWDSLVVIQNYNLLLTSSRDEVAK